MNMDNVYWDWNSMQADGHVPSILAIGDSWFWYPFPGGSLLNYLGPLVKTAQHTILAHGYNGAEAFDYVQGKYRTIVRESLNSFGSGLSAVFVSGGGNDFAGFNDLRPLLKSGCGAETTAEGCFGAGSGRTLDRLMEKLAESYRSLIGQIYASTRPEIRVFLHNYDYAIPSGKGVLGGEPWLKSALDDAEVPAALQPDCVRFLIDRFTEMLETLVDESHDRVVLVDSRRTLARTDWANELHPKGTGFRKIAEGAWEPVLDANGMT